MSTLLETNATSSASPRSIHLEVANLERYMPNRHTAINDGKVEQRMIEIPKTLSLDMSDYKNRQLS